MEGDDPLGERVEKVEGKVDGLTERMVIVETQLGRITSHIESEIGLARSDLGRIEKRLFGEADQEYGGKIGHINRRVYRMEIWFLAIICASGILVFLFTAYEFVMRARTKP